MAAQKQASSRQAAPTIRATAGLGFFLREAYRAWQPKEPSPIVKKLLETGSR